MSLETEWVTRIWHLLLMIDAKDIFCVIVDVSSEIILAFHHLVLSIINNWFMLKRALSSYGARGKSGEHERSVRVGRGDSRGQL